ncbi:MAG: alpha/beta hydrolase [Jatrophihabitans sp.]|nr:MAG: alpha/beta hydrolase [Jatrophihabitans sp.]
MGYLRRQLGNVALTANAIRPVPGAPAAVPAFVAGWLTAELAPHLLAATVADTAVSLARRRADPAALVAAVAAASGQVALIRDGARAGAEVEAALRDALGPDYRDELPGPADEHAPWQRLVNPFAMGLPGVTRTASLPYAPGGRRFELDVYAPAEPSGSGAPVLLQIHGGAWIIGTKDQQGVPLMMHLASRGWVCVAANYPLSPRARWPEHLVAIKRAVRWIREHGAEYGADPSFLAVTGGSAGGHLAAMVALTANEAALQPGFEGVDTAVQACVPHYGVYDFTAESGAGYTRKRLDSMLRRYVMSGDAAYPQDYRAASPLYRVRADAPPFLVIHGRNDTLVPPVEARVFVERLRQVSRAPVGYAEISGAQHAFDIFPSVRSARVVRGVARFLDVVHRRWQTSQLERVTVDRSPGEGAGPSEGGT